MKIKQRVTHGILVVIAAAMSLVISGSTAVADPPEGFKKLFNGKDLDGWKGLVADPEKRAMECQS